MASLPKFLLDCAKDPAIDPQKFAALVSAYHIEQAHDAELAFVAAFHKMQPDLPVIDENGVITYRDGRKGTYALNEDIQTAVAPILWKHGFTMSFESTYPGSQTRVDGVLTHKGGHSRRSSFESGTDSSGGKTSAQGRGSIISYGMRYTTITLLNLVTKGVDSDGAEPEPPQMPLPDGFDSFSEFLSKAAERGSVALATVWGGAPYEYRVHYPNRAWQLLKTIAEKADGNA